MTVWTTAIFTRSDRIFPAGAFAPSNLHLEVIQRTTHITFKGLCQTSSSGDVSLPAVTTSYSATSLRQLNSPSPSRLHVPASVALVHLQEQYQHIIQLCLRLAGRWQARLEFLIAVSLQHFAIDHRLLDSRISCTSVTQEREIKLSPVVRRTIETLSLTPPKTRVSASVARCSA